MRILGLDIGSTYLKGALMEGRELKALELFETSYNPLEKSLNLIKKYKPDKVVTTGYGRKLLYEHLKEPEVIDLTEIKAFALGAKFVHERTRTIIDIGGQDTKIIRLDEKGRVLKFEMNDKCSAGTGRFLEVMARSLGYTLSEVASFRSYSEPKVRLNSMCTVFAESEVISMIARDIPREEILKAVILAITQRVLSMLKRVCYEEDIVFAGGCAHHYLLKVFLEREIKKPLIVPKEHQFLGAIGAALYGLTL